MLEIEQGGKELEKGFGKSLVPGREAENSSWLIAQVVGSCSGTDWGQVWTLEGEHPHQLHKCLEPNEARLRFRVVTVLLNWLSGSLCKASSAS